MKLRLLCTDDKSESAARLANKLSEIVGYKVYRSPEVKAYRQHIRYGDARDKLTQYKYFRAKGLNFPGFTESKEEAIELSVAGYPIVCRTLLKGQEGHGIVIADRPREIVDAPVYVIYREKTLEYRVNFFKGLIVNIREKRKKLDAGVVEEDRIRNVDNGYVYCIPRTIPSIALLETAFQATKITDSDIVGVDVAYNKNTNRHFLLEVNSAPSLEGVTVDEMAGAIMKWYKARYVE